MTAAVKIADPARFSDSGLPPGPVGGDRRRDDRGQRGGQRQVSPEDEAPAGQVGDDPAHHETAGACGGARRAPGGDGPVPGWSFGGERGQQAERGGYRGRGRRPLQAAAGREGEDRRRGAGHRGPGGEHGQADQDRAAMTVAVAEPRAEHQQAAEEHGVAGRDQAAVGVRGVQAGQHRGQRGDHHGHAENVHELHQA